MTETCDVLVIGAGVIGLAVGRALSNCGREVLIVERHEAIGTETSSRNSEVIHAGIYYPTGSKKAELCVRGKHLLYTHCEQYRVPYERIGKIIVATREDQFEVLRNYQKQAVINGVGELTWLDKSEIRDREPAVECLAGVFSPTTGIIDSHAFMLSLEGELESNGGMIAFNTPVESLHHDGETLVDCTDIQLRPQLLINAAGLHAPNLSRQLGGRHKAYFAKGHYYTLSGTSPFNHLVYPVAASGGLGVHVTLDLAHQARFGPDVEWIDEADYDFSEENRSRFIETIRMYYPDLDESRLNAGYTGIRPKLAPPSQPSSDFVINGPQETGIPNYVELLGIESPGLTAALAIAEDVVQMTQSA